MKEKPRSIQLKIDKEKNEIEKPMVPESVLRELKQIEKTLRDHFEINQNQ